MTEFYDLGAHCQFDGCNQKDFLPFKCDKCNKYYCLEVGKYGRNDEQLSEFKIQKISKLTIDNINRNAITWMVF